MKCKKLAPTLLPVSITWTLLQLKLIQIIQLFLFCREGKFPEGSETDGAPQKTMLQILSEIVQFQREDYFPLASGTDDAGAAIWVNCLVLHRRMLSSKQCNFKSIDTIFLKIICSQLVIMILWHQDHQYNWAVYFILFSIIHALLSWAILTKSLVGQNLAQWRSSQYGVCIRAGSKRRYLDQMTDRLSCSICSWNTSQTCSWSVFNDMQLGTGYIT